MLYSNSLLSVCAWGSGSGPTVRRNKFFARNPEFTRNCLSDGIGRFNLATLDGSDHGGADAGRFAQLRLGKPAQHAQIPRKALARGDFDEVIDRGTKCGHNFGEDVDLRRRFTDLPVVQGRSTDTG